jgi:CheY-like chemotaxis protein
MKQHRYTYQEAGNGLEALEAYRNSASKFHTILMDMSMPISKLTVYSFSWGVSDIFPQPLVDGMTSTRAIRDFEDTNNLVKCRIVALTGLASASARLEALSSGVDYFMTKPMNFKALETLLKRSNERSRKFSESQILKGLEEVDHNQTSRQRKTDNDEQLEKAAKVESQQEADSLERSDDTERIRPLQEGGSKEQPGNIESVELQQKVATNEVTNNAERTEPQEEADSDQQPRKAEGMQSQREEQASS